MKLPILIFAGRDEEKREFLKEIDPEGKYKAKMLMPMHGKTVLEWVVEEFLKSDLVDGVYILGLTREDIDIEGDVHYIPSGLISTLAEKFYAALDYLKKEGKFNDYLVFCSSDCPGLKLETIDAFINYVLENSDLDFILSMITEECIEKEFPNAGRGMAIFKDENLIQGELMMISAKAVRKYGKVIDNFMVIRKKRAMGPLLWYVARRPLAWTKLIKIGRGKGNLNDAIIGFKRAFRLKAAAPIYDDPGLGLDMDLSEDYERLKDYIKKTKL
jgi:hypothetical protein